MNFIAAEGNSICVLIADDHPVVRDGLAGVIEEQDDMAVVGQASTGMDALALHREHRPDVTLLDLRMPGMNGIETILAIRRQSPAARAIILSTYDTDEDIYGVRSRNGKNRTLRIGKRTERPEFATLDLFALAPGIIAGQIDVFPAQW